MDELDREIGRLQAENQGISSSSYTLPIQREDSYETPSDIQSNLLSSPLSILLGFSDPPQDFALELASEPASERSIGSVIEVDYGLGHGRWGRV